MSYISKFFQNFLSHKFNSFSSFLVCLFFFPADNRQVHSEIQNPLNQTHQEEDILKSRILYLMKIGKEPLAFDLYQEHVKSKKGHDGDLLEKIALLLIEKGFNSNDLETQVLSLFGAGISTNEETLSLLKEGLNSNYPQIQLIALNFLSRLHHDNADQTLYMALNSDFLPIRLEAAFYLASMKAPKIEGLLESLMIKVNPELLPIFPQFFALIGTQEAMKTLVKLLNHPNEKVRVQAIINVAKKHLDDLLPIIRKLSTHGNVLQQEATAYAFGKMKDETAVTRLEILKESKTSAVRLAALLALYQLGQKERRLEIEKMAEAFDLYAIYALSEIEESEPLLKKLAENEHLNIRINATFSLLKIKSPHAIPGVLEILIKDSRDLGFIENQSLGETLKYIKAVPSAKQNFKNNEFIHEVSLNFRETILDQAVQLREAEFLKIATILFETKQSELIPNLVLKLEELGTKDSINLLKKYQQQIGVPLIRNYCNLALFRLKEKGPYRDNLEKFILQEIHTDLIQFRPFLPLEMRSLNTHFQLTPHESSKLLVEAFEAIALSQDLEGLNLLFHAIEKGNQKNRYALAGLLMHATR